MIDVAMTEMDGITWLEKLLDHHGKTVPPIVMLTVSVLAEDHERARVADAADFLTKPISSWELLEVVERQLTEATI